MMRLMLRARWMCRAPAPSRGRLVEVGNEARPDRDDGEGDQSGRGRDRRPFFARAIQLHATVPSRSEPVSPSRG